MDEIHNRPDSQLSHDRCAVSLNRFHADAQDFGYFFVALGFRKELNNFPLPTGQHSSFRFRLLRRIHPEETFHDSLCDF
jgi:hypothetical protein